MAGIGEDTEAPKAGEGAASDAPNDGAFSEEVRYSVDFFQEIRHRDHHLSIHPLSAKAKFCEDKPDDCGDDEADDLACHVVPTLSGFFLQLVYIAIGCAVTFLQGIDAVREGRELSIDEFRFLFQFTDIGSDSA